MHGGTLANRTAATTLKMAAKIYSKADPF